MGQISISETQLSFGYLHSFLNVHNVKKFVLPTLRQEGGTKKFKFPGADLVINNNHLIQFKRPFYYTTNGIKEFWNYSQPSDIWAPYFRIHIKNADPTNQLENLVKATKSGLRAEYVSPTFTTETEFYKLLTNDKDHLNSYAHIDIKQFDSWLSQIGKNDDHTIIYTTDSISKGFCYCFSEPKKIEASSSMSFNSDSEFKLLDIISIINYCFWNNENPQLRNLSNSIKNENSFSLIRNLQTQLLTEKGIFWTFSIKNLDEVTENE